MKKMTVKSYASIVKNAPAKIKAQGKATIKCYSGDVGGYSNESSKKQDPFFGPSLRERLRGWARASIIVTVVLDRIVLRGRIISVDGDGFEMTIVEQNHKSGDHHNHLFQPGSIVFISFKQVNAVAAGGGVF